MYEIRLIVHRQPDAAARAAAAYSAAWFELGNQTSESFPLVLPLDADDAGDLRWYLESYYQLPGPGDHARARGIEAKLREWGRALFDALFGTAEGTQVYNNLMRRPAPRLLTLSANEPDVLMQPWEMMRDRRGPLAFRGVTVRRQFRGAKLPPDYALGLPLRVLLIVSRPSDAGFINPRVSSRHVLDALDELPPGQVTVDFCDPPTLTRLAERIAQAREAGRPYHIVHFDGHGAYLPRTGVGALRFEDDRARTHLVPGAQLGDLLSRLEVPLAMLEACRTADLSERPVFGSVAPALLESGVGSVVAFSHAVHVEAVRLLVEHFYCHLVAGRTVGQALEEARAQLRARPARWLHLGPDAATVDLQDWFVPQLYQVGADPALIDREAAQPGHPERSAGSLAPSERVFHNFPPPPMYRFYGRALELLETARAFRRHPALVLSGMGGMGKTALAREAAWWWLRTGRFEAAVFTSFETRIGAERAVQILGQALEGDHFSARTADDQWAAAVHLFRTRRVLWVWDNFESTLPAFQSGAEGLSSLDDAARARLGRLYRELTATDPRPPEGRLLVTCRPAETGLPGIVERSLEGLARPD